jgi:hypothetical protein
VIKWERKADERSGKEVQRYASASLLQLTAYNHIRKLAHIIYRRILLLHAGEISSSTLHLPKVAIASTNDLTLIV